jgi:hypothetical protein
MENDLRSLFTNPNFVVERKAPPKPVADNPSRVSVKLVELPEKTKTHKNFLLTRFMPGVMSGLSCVFWFFCNFSTFGAVRDRQSAAEALNASQTVRAYLTGVLLSHLILQVAFVLGLIGLTADMSSGNAESAIGNIMWMFLLPLFHYGGLVTHEMSRALRWFEKKPR